MKRYRVSDLEITGGNSFLKGLVPGDYLSRGGMSFKKPGQRSHDVGCTCSNCDSKGRHVHKDECEVFVLLQGKAHMEIDGTTHEMYSGDIIVCEPGEDHHLVADKHEPCVNLALHTSETPHFHNEA